MFLFILKRDRGRRIQKRPHLNAQGKGLMIRSRIGGGFCEDAFGRDGHGHVQNCDKRLLLS